MQDNLLPEAIRGSWYMLADDDKPITEAIEKKGQLLTLRLSGRFSRYDISMAASLMTKVEKDEGDYTFDGDFLILRGRNTETYRVRVDADWCWLLEAKKKERKLVRGQLTKSDFVEWAPDETSELQTLAHRVQAESAFPDQKDAIFELFFCPSADRRTRIGCFSLDLDAANRELWLGLTPLVTNLDAETWQKIIAQSCAMLVRTNPAEIERVWLDIPAQDIQCGIEVSG